MRSGWRVLAGVAVLACLSAAGEHIIRNPTALPVSGLPLAIADAEVRGPVLVKDAAGEIGFASQLDVFHGVGEPRQELVLLADLDAGATVAIVVSPGLGVAILGGTAPSIQRRDDATVFGNGLIAFTMNERTFRHRDSEEDLRDFYFSDFVFPDKPETPVGLAGFGHSGANRCLMLGHFVEAPEVQLLCGPVRATLVLRGKASICGFKEEVLGVAETRIHIYRGKRWVDLDLRFTPAGHVMYEHREQRQKMYCISWAGLSLDSAAGPWDVSSVDYRTGEPVWNRIGVEEKSAETHGRSWVAARGPLSSLSYVIDDGRSTFNLALSKQTGSYRSSHRIRLWNFDLKRNYLLPTSFGTVMTPGTEQRVRTRLAFHPEAHDDVGFARRDYAVFTTPFAAERLVKNRSAYEGAVALSAADAARVAELARTHDLVFVGAGAAAVAASAARLGAPVLADSAAVGTYFYTQFPKNADRGVVPILVGGPSENSIVAAHNARCGFVDAYWPGVGKGRITVVEDFVVSGRAAVFVGGIDPAGTAAAMGAVMGLLPVAEDRVCVRVLSPWVCPRPWMRGRRGEELASLQACRGETEPLHLLAFFPRDVRNLSADIQWAERVSGLTAEVDHIAWSYDRSPGGAWVSPLPLHDAMRPGMPHEVSAGSQLSVWVTLETARDTPAGRHEGLVRLRWDGGRASVAFIVDVLDVQLPADFPLDFSPMYTPIGYNRNLFELYLGWQPRSAAYYAQLTAFARQLSRHGATVASLANDTVELRAHADGTWELDAAPFFKEIEAYRRGGIPKYEVSRAHHHWQTMVHGLARLHGVSVDEGWRLFGERFSKLLEQHGVAGQVYIRVGDEPREFSTWVEQAKRVKPLGMRLTVCHNRCALEQMQPAIGVIDTWCPNWLFLGRRYGAERADDAVDVFSADFLRERRRAGDEIWSYNCACGAPCAHFTALPTEIRFWWWDCYLRDLDGIRYYGSAVWSHQLRGYRERETETADSFRRGESTHLLYPDKANGRVLGSQRWELFLQAAEDTKLFALASAGLSKADLRALVSRHLAKQRERVLPREVPFWWQDLEPELMAAIRHEVIERLRERTGD